MQNFLFCLFINVMIIEETINENMILIMENQILLLLKNLIKLRQ